MDAESPAAPMMPIQSVVENAIRGLDYLLRHLCMATTVMMHASKQATVEPHDWTVALGNASSRAQNFRSSLDQKNIHEIRENTCVKKSTRNTAFQIFIIIGIVHEGSLFEY